jgi:hypothetical protein
MDIEIFALCDAATDSGGKLNILGAFDRIYVRQLPAVHPHCAIALRIRFDRIEAGEHRVRISLIDADGKPVIPSLDGNINVNIPPDLTSICANLVLDINGLKLEKADLYSIELAIDGRHEKSLPLTVVQIKPPRQSPEQPPPPSSLS